MDKYIDYTYIKTNRNKAHTPKRGAGWCRSCDRYYYTSYQKCPVCGTRNRPFTLKKEPI